MREIRTYGLMRGARNSPYSTGFGVPTNSLLINLFHLLRTHLLTLLMNPSRTAEQPNSRTLSGWRCSVVSLSEQGYERLETQDTAVIDWLKDQLLQRITASEDDSCGARCYHLKGNGGIAKASEDLRLLLDSGDYPYVIRSDAKGYYAHIRHHKLIGLLNDLGFNRQVCHVITQLCQRMTVRRGIYSERTQGIPLGCAASPALAAIYLSPLDHAISKIPGVKYLRYMDDWVILCPSRWKMRRAIKLMHQTLKALGQHVHPDKTFIGKAERGFDFLGIDFKPKQPLSVSKVSARRLDTKIFEKLSQAAQLYEQGRLKSLEPVELYFTHWLRWIKGAGVASQAALATIRKSLLHLCNETANVMIKTFTISLLRWVDKQKNTIQNELHNKKSGESCIDLHRSVSRCFTQSGGCGDLL